MSHPGGQDGGDPSGSIEPVQGRRIGATREISGPEGAEEASAMGGAEALDGAESAGATAGVDAVETAEGVGALDSTEAVAAALDAGAIDAEAARAALIDQAVAAHLPPGADPALAAEVRAELAAALADDPTLGALLGGGG